MLNEAQLRQRRRENLLIVISLGFAALEEISEESGLSKHPTAIPLPDTEMVKLVAGVFMGQRASDSVQPAEVIGDVLDFLKEQQ